MTLRVRRLNASAQLPERAHDGDAGYDLRALEPGTLVPGERASVGTGIALALPPGHAGLVTARSGLAIRHGIALVNAPGIIDEGYRGEIRVVLINTDRTDVFSWDAGDRIAQLVIVAVALPGVVESDDLGVTDRGVGGFGSSGLL